jgi:DNA-binding protein YbaB
MSDTDFLKLREMIRRLQRQVAKLEKQLEEKSVTT